MQKPPVIRIDPSQEVPERGALRIFDGWVFRFSVAPTERLPAFHPLFPAIQPGAPEEMVTVQLSDQVHIGGDLGYVLGSMLQAFFPIDGDEASAYVTAITEAFRVAGWKPPAEPLDVADGRSWRLVVRSLGAARAKEEPIVLHINDLRPMLDSIHAGTPYVLQDRSLDHVLVAPLDAVTIECQAYPEDREKPQLLQE